MSDAEILALESELRDAQLASDVAALDRLIDDDLLFAGPGGELATKAEDLAAHRNGAIRFSAHEPEEVRVRRVGDDVAIVSLRARLRGEFGGAPFAGTFRYTRVWARARGQWRIVAGQVSQIAGATASPS
jgi:ketosteroid isomerase-like protein